MRIRAVLLISAGIGFLSLFIGALILAGMTDYAVLYETSVFKAEFPAGSKVEQRDKRTNARVQHTFQAAVFTNGDTALALVEYTDFSIERSLSLEDVASETQGRGAGTFFLPGTVQSRPVADKTIGGLPAKEMVYYGTQTYDKKPGVLCERAAVKGNRVWFLMTSATKGSLSEQASIKFFDSVTIK
jgi:hypothetical protein